EDGTVITYRLTESPIAGAYVSAIVGDVLHNLRSALDQLAWQLVLFDGGTPNQLTTFPVLREPPTDGRGERVPVTIKPGIDDPRIHRALEEAQPFHEAT